MKYIIIPVLYCFTMISAIAQSVPETGARRQPGGRIYGKVIDAKTNKGFDAASVQIIKKVPDVLGGSKDSVIAGMLTPSNGNFSFDNIPFGDSLRVFITAVGYGILEKPMQLKPSPGINGLERDL